ncbi:MAG TPA: transporter [Nitrospirota bacterium]|nr:transporter [Nitrospirota bacterium]
MKKIAYSLLLAVVTFWAMKGYAAHPLITDDSGTQGKGKFQFEFNGQYDHDKDHDIKNKATILNAVLTYGADDTVDVAAGIPYLYTQYSAPGVSDSQSGNGDASLNVKWRFFEKNGLSFALKPGITFATGNDTKGLGTGRMTYSMFFITTKETKPWAFSANVGYIRNENTAEERTDIWHASVAAIGDIAENLKFVIDAGLESNREKTTHSPPEFLLAGLIYSVKENLDLDAGAKMGLNEAEVDYSLLAGLTLRF